MESIIELYNTQKDKHSKLVLNDPSGDNELIANGSDYLKTCEMLIKYTSNLITINNRLLLDTAELSIRGGTYGILLKNKEFINLMFIDRKKFYDDISNQCDNQLSHIDNLRYMEMIDIDEYIKFIDDTYLKKANIGSNYSMYKRKSSFLFTIRGNPINFGNCGCDYGYFTIELSYPPTTKKLEKLILLKHDLIKQNRISSDSKIKSQIRYCWCT